MVSPWIWISTVLLVCSDAWAAKPGVMRTYNASRVAGVQYYPPLNYKPLPSGIPFPTKNDTAAPWMVRNHAPVAHKYIGSQTKCSAGGEQGYWYENVEHNGESSFLSSDYKDNYRVFRNVVIDFKADNTGTQDASAAIQQAIQEGPENGPDRGSHAMGTTGQPAIVYLPGGTYTLDAPLQLYVGTVVMGDPKNPPVLKASSKMSGDHLIYSKDPNFVGTTNFYIALKNVALDSTALAANKDFALLDWGVSQATQLANVRFTMSQAPGTKHVGLTTQYDYNSNIMMNDLTFQGGSIGMKLSGQQWVFRNLNFQGTVTGVVAGGTDIVFLGCTFKQGTTGIDASGTSGSLTVIDSTGSGLTNFITSADSGNAGNAIILENVQNQGNTVTLGGKAVLVGNAPDTWVHGDLYEPGNPMKQRVQGKMLKTPRSSSLVSGKNYFTMAPPSYEEYSAGQVLNIKSVSGKPVYGDGATDDTANINSILSQSSGCDLIYFPAGTYIITDTVFVPAGTRIIGDAFASVLSAAGNQFSDANNPRAMLRLGYPGDRGVMQVTDMSFTVADILPGCKLVEVNIAGHEPGDVGIWNSHFRIGGAAGSQVETECTSTPANCKAAWGLLHLTSTSSAYIENMWGWTADHDLDGEYKQVIATGRGLLVEASSGTWLVGTGFEHHTLYQYNFQRARNVMSTLQQSESPYWQGPGNTLAPAPWQDNLQPDDPDFSQCAQGDATCRMSLFEQISGSSNLFLYGGCNWVFFNNGGDCAGNKCQKNAIQVLDSSDIYLYGTNTKSTENMILDGKTVIAAEDQNAGGWGGVVAGYLYNA